MAKSRLWLTLTAYGTNRPAKVRPEVIKAMLEGEWGTTIYLSDGDQISVTEDLATICALLSSDE